MMLTDIDDDMLQSLIQQDVKNIESDKSYKMK
jgi:hypothetical protein